MADDVPELVHPLEAHEDINQVPGGGRDSGSEYEGDYESDEGANFHEVESKSRIASRGHSNESLRSTMSEMLDEMVKSEGQGPGQGDQSLAGRGVHVEKPGHFPGHLPGPGTHQKQLSHLAEIVELSRANTRPHTAVESRGDKMPAVDFQQSDDLQKQLHQFFSQPSSSTSRQSFKPLRRPKLMYDNTYRLNSRNPFSVSRVESLIYYSLEEGLERWRYNAREAGEMAKMIAERIRRRVINYKFERYKLIVQVHIGPLERQGLHIGFRSLWDATRDKYAKGNYTNSTTYGLATVYGIYFE